MSVTNFAITRVTMQELHGVMRDVEALKYNEVQFQQLLVLQNRDSQTKKGTRVRSAAKWGSIR